MIPTQPKYYTLRSRRPDNDPEAARRNGRAGGRYETYSYINGCPESGRSAANAELSCEGRQPQDDPASEWTSAYDDERRSGLAEEPSLSQAAEEQVKRTYNNILPSLARHGKIISSVKANGQGASHTEAALDKSALEALKVV